MVEQVQKQSIKDYPKVFINFNPPIPPLKKVKDKTKIDVRYAVVSPFAFIHIHWDPKISEVVYDFRSLIDPLFSNRNLIN